MGIYISANKSENLLKLFVGIYSKKKYLIRLRELWPKYTSPFLK